MNYFEAFILGLIQGFAEPIPVSSSAQTQIAAFLLGVETPGIIFEVFLNFPSFLAILWLTRKDVFRITSDFFSYAASRDKEYKVNFNMALYVITGTLPVVILGFTMKDIIDIHLSSMTSIAFFLILTGALLFIVRNKNGERAFESMTYRDALIIGLIQGTLAVIPGVSRSGATIAAALLLGLNRDTSFRYSFLLYLPVGLGSMIAGGREIFRTEHFQDALFQYALMFIAVYVATIYSFKLFRSMVRKGQLSWFTAYCWLVALALFCFF